MKEQIIVGGKKVLILVEPHTFPDTANDPSSEYFTASYCIDGTPSGPAAVLFLDVDNTPKQFKSPVQALEYASEKLLGLI